MGDRQLAVIPKCITLIEVCRGDAFELYICHPTHREEWGTKHPDWGDSSIARVKGRSPEDPWIGQCKQSRDTLTGSLKALLGDPQGVEGVGKGLCTSVTASRMTDAYGASTLRVPHG